MIGSLATAVTGLRSHQIKMDSIGNNIANVNTYGFKGTEVRFEDLFYQTRQAATATLIRGGTNPIQTGKGVQVAATMVNHSQGSIKNTDRIGDLAIEGDGFFIVNNGVMNYYTRDGSFSRDAEGNLVNANGFMVMGWMGDPHVMETSHEMVPINIPIGEHMIANATTNATIVGNLDSKAEIGDTYVHEHYYYDSLGVRYDVEYTFTKSLGELGAENDEINYWDYEVAIFEHMDENFGFQVVPQHENITLRFRDPGDTNEDLSLTISGAGMPVEVDGNRGFFVTADANEVLSVRFVISNTITDPVEIENVNGNITVLFQSGTSYDDIASQINGSAHPLTATYEVDYEATEGRAGKFTALPLNDVTVNLQTNGNGEVMSSYREIRDLIESDAHASAVFRVRHSADPTIRNRVAVADEFVTGFLTDDDSNTYNLPITGHLQFDSYGNLLPGQSNVPNVVYKPDDAALLDTVLDFTKVTQLAGNYTVIVRDQDGYASGELFRYDVTVDGIITGIYTNGITEDIGRIGMAAFANPEGLHRHGGNLYQITANSGDPRVGYPGQGGRGVIRSSALEMSNVDLSVEFTELITSSRGFQANTRMVTTSDEILVEVLNMKR